MKVRTYAAVVSLSLIAVIALAGCASAQTAGGPASSPSATPGAASATSPSASTATPTPTPTAAATKPALADLVVSPDGIGPLLIGEPVPDEPKAQAVAVWDAKKCYRSSATAKVGDPAVGGWTANYPLVSVGAFSSPGFSVYTVGDVEDGDIHSLWVESPKLTTAEGISIGSTLAEVRAAYPSPDHVITSNRYADLYVLDGTVGRMTIEVAKKNTAGLWTADQVGTVRVIHLQPKTEAAFGASGDSDGLGICSETPGFAE